MINLESEFSPRVNHADANYPFGSIKDNSSPGANDGTPLAAVWGNDWEGFAQAAMTEAGITPSGLPDTAQDSQLLDAVKAVTSGALRNELTESAFVKSNTSDYPSLQSAVDSAIAANRSVIDVTSDIISPDVTKKGSVALIGDGMLSGVQRKRVAREIDQQFAAWNDLNPDAHLARFLSKDNPVVVVVGDSIATESADSIGRTASLYSELKGKITHAYPNKNITFHNRAIGGETYFSSVGVPSSFPSWYTNPETAWCVYVGALNPDLVIFNFGMNDTVDFQSVTVRMYAETLMTNPALFPSGKPDIIYCTNLTPSVNTTVAGFADEAGQGGRDMCAGYTRSYAKANGYGLLDFHRMCTIVKDGFDPCATYLKKVGAVTPASGAVTAPFKCTDFRWEMAVSSLTSASPVTVKLSHQEVTDAAGRGGFVIITDSSGFLNVTLYDTPTHIYADASPVSIPTPPGAFTLTVEKRQSSLVIELNGSVIVTYNKLLVNGRAFFPRAGDATYSSGNITGATFYYGEFVTYKQSLLNDEMWGASELPIATKYPIGGNGVNHPTSKAVAQIFKPVIENSSWTGSKTPMTSTTDLSLVNGWTGIAGFARPSVTVAGDTITVAMHLTPPTLGATGVIATLPVDYRPRAGEAVFVRLFGPGNTSGGATAQILPDGEVSIVSSTSEAWLYGSMSFTK